MTEREKAITWMDERIASNEIKLQKSVIVKMRIHEEDMSDFIKAMFGAIDYIRIQQN